MIQNTPKRKIKDSVFTNLFQDKKYLLQLYKALHPEDSSASVDEIDDVTIKHVLIDADYNDLGFSLGNRLLVLVESQSSWSVNIVIRALMYLVQTYHDYFKRTNQNLYGSKKVLLPAPELYMIFTGQRKHIPDTISLSKEFFAGASFSVDAHIKVLYQEDPNNIIGQYIIFSKIYNQQRNLYGYTKLAVTETIRICKDRNILKEYLMNKEQEVVDIMMTLFDDEQILKAYTKDIRDDTARETEKKTAEKLIQKGKMTLEEIADCVPNLTLEELKEIKDKIMQLS